jgi:hypothetical protein
MDEQEVKDLINLYIVTNHNNEITAAILNPILIAIVEQSNDLIGNLNDLITPDNIDLVEAINSVQTQINAFSFTGVQVYSGVDDPNDTPPLTYAVADFYKQLDGGGNTIALFQYNGTEWVNLSDPPYVGTLQEVTDVGATTDVPIVVTDESETESLTHGSDGITYNAGGFTTEAKFAAPTANRSQIIPDKDGTFAMVGDITSQSLSFGTVVSVANTIQDDRLIGLDDSVIPFPFSISADNATWTEFDGVQFSTMAFDNITGTITDFPVTVGKKVFLTLIK